MKMELLDEIRASRNVGRRRVDPNRGGWEDMGVDVALKQPSLLRRYERTMEFVTASTSVEKLRNSVILDSGEPNPLTRWLEKEYQIKVNNTPPDMDFDYCHRYTPQKIHDFVFAFEILEHIMNPLGFLEFLTSSLNDQGRVFLSTPFIRPRFLWSKYHITEYYPDKVEELAAKAGLTVIRYKRVNTYPFGSGILGIRPFFRLWFERIMLFEMVKTASLKP